jgi:hypothetical protein
MNSVYVVFDTQIAFTIIKELHLTSRIANWEMLPCDWAPEDSVASKLTLLSLILCCHTLIGRIEFSVSLYISARRVAPRDPTG